MFPCATPSVDSGVIRKRSNPIALLDSLKSIQAEGLRIITTQGTIRGAVDGTCEVYGTEFSLVLPHS